MTQQTVDVQYIALENIALDLDNPRHEPYQTQDEVIEYLCRNEYIYALAQDIVNMGTNPLELMALIPDETRPGKYIIAEGNRRLCALKLLADPERAPAADRKSIKALSTRWVPQTIVPAIIFPNRESVSGWLERIHGGTQGGIGRKSWSAEQKTRFTGNTKNLMAQQLLDYAQTKGMISAEERSSKLSTVQRFISSPLFRDALGLDNSKNDEIQYTRPDTDFDAALRQFIHDLKQGNINTRYNAQNIKEYSHRLRAVEGVGTDTVPPRPLNPKTTHPAPAAAKPAKPSKPRYLVNQEQTEQALKELDNYKLLHLYHSLHSLSAVDHCPLLTIGLWSFMETLTALCGRKEGTDFTSFLSGNKLTQLGVPDKSRQKVIRQCLTRLCDNGNTSKHDQQAAAFNDQQLINDFEQLHPLIQALASAARTQNKTLADDGKTD